jgi:fructan beta-fructosidase
MQTLRGEHFQWLKKVVKPDTNPFVGLRGNSLEIIAVFKLNDAVRRFGIRVRVGPNEQTAINYDRNEKNLCVDRTRSGQVDFHNAFARVHTAKLCPIDGEIRLHIFVDASSLEVFANDGLLTFTESIFPSHASQGLELFVEGGTILLQSLDVFRLNPAQFQIVEK